MENESQDASSIGVFVLLELGKESVLPSSTFAIPIEPV